MTNDTVLQSSTGALSSSLIFSPVPWPFQLSQIYGLDHTFIVVIGPSVLPSASTKTSLQGRPRARPASWRRTSLRHPPEAHHPSGQVADTRHPSTQMVVPIPKAQQVRSYSTSLVRLLVLMNVLKRAKSQVQERDSAFSLSTSVLIPKTKSHLLFVTMFLLFSLMQLYPIDPNFRSLYS